MKAPRRPKSVRSLVSCDFIEQLESRQLLAATLAGGVLTVAGGKRADNIRVDRTGANIVVRLGNSSKRFASSQVSSVVINAGKGNDRVTVVKGIANVSIDGGAGNDVINGGGGSDLINGGAGDDVIKGRGGNDQIYGGAGDDKIFGGAGNDTLGGDDEDIVWTVGSSKPADQVGNDVLNGGAGDDWLLSGMESDIFNDPSGNDQLTGGPGNDVIDTRGRQTTGQLFETGNGDTITDQDANDIVPVNDVTGPFSGNEADYSQHRHAFIKIFLEDASGHQTLIDIPSRVGEFLGEPVVHTHDNPSPLDVRGFLMHFHNTPTSGGATRVLTLGDFFEHWGVSLSSQNLGRLRVDAKHTLTMQVKVKGQGNLVTPTQNFNKYVIQTDTGAADTAYDQIVIVYKTL